MKMTASKMFSSWSSEKKVVRLVEMSQSAVEMLSRILDFSLEKEDLEMTSLGKVGLLEEATSGFECASEV